MATSPRSQETSWSPSISSAEVSPARISARPESRPVSSRELARAFGLSTPVWWGNLDPDGCSLRTSQGSLFTTQCDELSENWPDSGMWGSGVVYELQNSEPVTSENGSSLWPTATANPATYTGGNAPGYQCLPGAAQRWPTAVANDDNKSPEAHLAMKQRMGERDGTFANRTAITSLAVKVQTWPTATNGDSKSAARHTTTTGIMHPGTTLTDAINMWPTARAEDSESCGNHPGATDSLTGATRNWPTPQEHDRHISGRTPEETAQARQRYQAGCSNLNDIATYWATPQEDNANNAGGPSRTNGTYRDLMVDAIHWRTPNTRDHHPGGPRLDADQRQISICDQAAIWQTPGTDSFRSRGGDRKDEMGLDQEARHWGTPQAHPRQADPRDVDHGVQLANQVSLWQTPNARDWKSETGSENNTYDKSPNLSRQVYRLSHQDPVTQDGPTSSECDQTSLQPSVSMKPRLLTRRLNPRFVEWLMGFPLGWTELD